ncbi:MAG: hypothetical protein L0Y57_08175 [Beijerinckiaceae bacterium]|nr:hypothetical protein [Beijerinckiaceae bacterium]
MSKVLEYIKSAIQIAFGLILLAIILLNFHGLYLASQKFLEKATTLRSIKLFGVEVDLDAMGVDRALFRADYLTGADRSRILAVIEGLQSKEFMRLMYVGQLKNLCEFETPSAEMRNFVALDYGLEAKGLTKIEVNAATLALVRAELAKLASQGKQLENGYPLKCYEMSFTDDGYNVKTVLVDNLSQAFGGPDRQAPRPGGRSP